MTSGPSYCRYCEEQIESCLAAAREQDDQRTYFLTLAWRWARLARDLESRAACGIDCPLHKTCAATLPPIIENGLTVPAAARRLSRSAATDLPATIPAA
jgi:hypothetical protein